MATLEIQETAAIQRRKMSYEEYLRFAGDAQIVEWVDGEALIYMPAMFEHQNIITFLLVLLRSFVEYFELGIVITAPFEVKLWPDGPSREPDLIFIANDNLSQLTSKRFTGGPDLLVEIVSQGSVSQDRVYKFREYEQAGVQEYWLLDRRPRQQQVDCYIMGEDGTFYPKPVNEDGRYYSEMLPGFWFDPAWLWLQKLPDPQFALAQLMLTSDKLPEDIRQAYQAIHNRLTNKQ